MAIVRDGKIYQGAEREIHRGAVLPRITSLTERISELTEQKTEINKRLTELNNRLAMWNQIKNDLGL